MPEFISGNVFKRGDLVCFIPPDDVRRFGVAHGIFRENDYLMKVVGALPGDSFSIKNSVRREFWVNGKYIGDVVRKNLPAAPFMEHPYGDFTVEDGMFLPIAPNPFSFDGRYYGTVPLSSIVFRVIPIWTER